MAAGQLITYSSSDAGWGCTLRATQMCTAAALFAATGAASHSLFQDSDGALGLAALHAGPPRWYTPSSAIAAICAAAARASPRVPLSLFCAGGGILVPGELPACPLLLFFPLVLSPEDLLSQSAAARLAAQDAEVVANIRAAGAAGPAGPQPQ